ncbi:hypothetical protein HII27_26920, partial [Kluyvera sp. SCKS090646]|nr:hypothetical protein [Kluyvera sichuanensis]
GLGSLPTFGTAASKDVGTGAGQIPDMSSFPCLLEENGWEILPNGKIKQWGLVQMSSSEGGNKVVPLPIPFPGKALNAHATINAPTNYSGNIAVYVVDATNTAITLVQDNATATYIAKVYWEVTGK